MSEGEKPRLPSFEEVEAHFQDNAGSLPVAREFDAPPGSLCGNGLRFYGSVRARKLPPADWVPPPPPGSDPDYQGPSPLAPFKESPYAMPAPQVVLARPPVIDQGEPAFAEALRRLVGYQGAVGVCGGRDAAATFPFLFGRTVAIEPDLLDGEDEAAVAQRLAAQGIVLVLADRTDPPMAPWVEERMSSLRLRLRDAGDLHWFHPRIVGSGWAVYAVAPPLVLSVEDKQRLCRRVREVLTGKGPGKLDIDPSTDAVGDPSHRVIVSLRMRGEPAIKGRKLAKRMGRAARLLPALDAAAGKLRRGWAKARKAVAEDFGVTLPEKLRDALDRIEIEVEIVTDLCLLTDRRPSSLHSDLQIGLEGLYLWDEQQQAGHYLEPAHAIHRAIASPVVFLETCLLRSDLTEYLRPAKDPAVRRHRPMVVWEQGWQADTKLAVHRFRTLHWIEQPGEAGEIVELYRGVPLQRDVTRAALVRALQLGAGWLMNNQTADGQYAYKYAPQNKPERRWSACGNIVRHALNPYTLLLVNAIAPDPALVASARRGIDFTLTFLRWEGNRCVICHRDPPARFYNAKLGTNAVTILSILKLGEVADIGAYEPVVLGLAEELLFQQDPNGHFWQYDVPPEHPYYGAENPIAPGEFILALARMHKRFGDQRYQDAIERALAYYLTSWRAWRQERTASGIYDEEHRVNLVGIVPWLVMAMKDLHDSTGERRYADIAFEMQDWMEGEFFYTPQRCRYPDWLGGSYKLYSELPAVNSCQYIEGASAAFALAKRLDHDVERRRQVVVLGARFCLQLQYQGYGSSFFLPAPEEAMGGFRYTLSHLHLRNDFSYHAMAALAQAVSYLDDDDYRVAAPLLARLKP